MVKNVIFDIGNVLIDYSPKRLLDTFELSHEEKVLLIKTVFGSDLWNKLDRGEHSIAEAIEIFCNNLPEYTEYIKSMFTEDSLEILFSENKDTVEFMRSLKHDGYKVYLLSNFSREGFDFVYERHVYLKEFDGMIISSHVKINKPDRGIYECLLNKYSLNPAESLFFDDLEQNCAGAEELGIKAVQFTNLDDAKAKFYKIVKE